MKEPLQNEIKSSPNTAYFILNISFMAIIVAIFLYSATYTKNSHPIHALLTEKTGIIPPSKGLSAGFSEIMHGNIREANTLNPHSIRIFSFFAIQLTIRILSILAIKNGRLNLKSIATIDILVTAALFVVCFAPLIVFTLKLFVQVLQ